MTGNAKLPPAIAVLDLMTVAWFSRAILTAAKFGILEHIVHDWAG